MGEALFGRNSFERRSSSTKEGGSTVGMPFVFYQHCIALALFIRLHFISVSLVKASFRVG